MTKLYNHDTWLLSLNAGVCSTKGTLGASPLLLLLVLNQQLSKVVM